MSGIHMMLLGSGGGVTSGNTYSPTNVHVGVTGIYSASVTFNSDGTVTVTGTSPAANNWYAPTSPGIGSSFSVRITTTSSLNTSIAGGVSGTWYSLAAGQGYTFSNSSSTTEGTGSATVAISPDGGATVFNIGTINWDVGYAP